MASIKSLLAQATLALQPVTDSARLEAEILLSLAAGKDRSYFRAWPESELTTEEVDHFFTLFCKRCEGLPIAYLTGHREFWSRDFKVNPNVLIPRPETELLIELSLVLIPQTLPLDIIDLGTGTGAIAITLAAERPLSRVTAVEINGEALDVARANALIHKTDNVTFIQSHWFDNIQYSSFNLVVSNPPYIAAEDPHLLSGDVRFEPQNALIAANRGLGDIEQIADQARSHLLSGGHLLIEHGYNQQTEAQAIFRDFQYSHVKTYNDLSGNPRVTYGQWLP